MILSAGKILEHYDTDKKYPVYGFGAKVREINLTIIFDAFWAIFSKLIISHSIFFTINRCAWKTAASLRPSTASL